MIVNVEKFRYGVTEALAQKKKPLSATSKHSSKLSWYSRAPVLIIVVIFGWLLVWELSFYLLHLNPLIFGDPISTIKVLFTLLQSGSFELSPNLYSTILYTGQELAVAFALNVAIGICVGLFLGFVPYLGRVFEPLLLAILAFPIIVLVPIIALVMGVGLASDVVIAVMIGFPYLLFNVSSAIRAVSPEYYTLGRSIGLGALSIARKIILPESSPAVLQGLRLCFAYTYIGVIVAEVLHKSKGFGYMLFWASDRFMPNLVFATLVVIIGIGAIVEIFFRRIDSRMLSWKVQE